jgi:hypothetical protein
MVSSYGISFLTGCAYAYNLKMKSEEVKIAEATTSSVKRESGISANSSGKSWHTIAVWTFSLSSVAVFSFVDFLRLLNDSLDKLDEDLDRAFTSEVVHNIRTKLHKKIGRLRKKLRMPLRELLSNVGIRKRISFIIFCGSFGTR